MKKLAVISIPEKLTDEEMEREYRRFTEIFARCGIDALPLILTSGWTLQVISPEQEPDQ